MIDMYLAFAFIMGGGVGAVIMTILDDLAERQMSVKYAEKLLRAAKARAAAKAAYEKEVAKPHCAGNGTESKPPTVVQHVHSD